jgi:IS66 Orf2 like protein
MLQLTPQSRIFVATEPVDFRKGIDGLAAVCRRVLGDNPLSGALYVFRNRTGTTLKIRPRSSDRPLYAFRGGLSGAGASSTDSKIAANIERGF